MIVLNCTCICFAQITHSDVFYDEGLASGDQESVLSSAVTQSYCVGWQTLPIPVASLTVKQKSYIPQPGCYFGNKCMGVSGRCSQGTHRVAGLIDLSGF